MAFAVIVALRTFESEIHHPLYCRGRHYSTWCWLSSKWLSGGRSVFMSRFGTRARRTLVVAATAGAMAGGGLLATPAFAGTAPGCVSVSTTTGTVTKTFRMTNNCSYSLRARMILARHSDTDCVNLAARGGYYWIQVARTAALSGVETC
ncbi:hypothetical protein MXD59_06690 [Frankia sp. Ag45/Mut15]|uniref:Secreted protein n=1 Tax=Frankia umida TaxID=573489 RepID=A0ABT0JV87_9ACTN|nr:hypothetical protein [Frankia umida]